MKIMSFSWLLYFLMSLSLSSLQGHDFRILVLPSGGSTAIHEAMLIQHIEQQTKKSVNELFDEIWCSSAGSIIAALLTAPETAHNGAQGAIRFFEDNFSSYGKAYYISSALCKAINKKTVIKDTFEWLAYDFSTDGAGSCPNNKIPLADIVQASCTVYPYLYRNPVTFAIDNSNYQHCIDPGSLCCTQPMVDPTGYFLKQFLPRLKPNDTVTIYFLGNAFAQSVDYEDIVEVLTNSAHASWRIHYDEKNYSYEQDNVQIKVINVPMAVNPEAIVARYFNTTNWREKIKGSILTRIFEKVVGKYNAAPNMLAAGIVPLHILQQESKTIINNSSNFQELLKSLN